MLHKRLANGLEVFIYEDHRSPIFNFAVFYKVGSMDERPGVTGVSHMVEHMTFKGSDQVDGPKLNRYVKRHGGNLNAGTNEDMTVYYMSMPVSEKEYPMWVWSDLMVNANFKAEDFESERKVIIEERRLRIEDDPIGSILETLKATAFWAHPYRWPIIGWMTDIEQVSRDQLYSYYKQFYRPDNATIVASGDVDADETMSLIEKYFGAIPGGTRPIVRSNAVEPKQIGMRRATIRKTAELPIVLLGFHAPNINDPRVYPLLIADRILSSGESCRIYRNIIHEKRLSVSAGGFYDYISRDPGLFVFYAQAAPDKTIDVLEKALWDEVDRVVKGDFTIEEIEKAKNIVEASFIYRSEVSLFEAYVRGQFQIVSNMETYENFENRIREVTMDEVKAACAELFIRDHATVVDLEPSDENGGGLAQEGITMPSKWFFYKCPDEKSQAPSGKLPDGLPFWKDADKFELSNGIKVINYHRGHLPIIQIGLLINAGAVFDPAGKAGLATLTANMLKAGTVSRNAADIAEEIERLGGQFDVSAQREINSIGMKFMSRHLKIALEILSECIMYPSFLDEEVGRYKEMLSGDIQATEDDVWMLTPREFVRNLYSNSPYGHPVSGDLETVDSLTRDDIVNFHKAHYTGSNFIMSLVGDFDQKTIRDDLEFFFSKLPKGTLISPPEYSTKPFEKIEIKRHEKKSGQASIMLGNYAFPRKSDDFFPFMVLNHIFGGDSLTSRLGDSVREKHGLTYFIQSGFNPMKKTGSWNIILQTKNETSNQAMDLIRREIDKIRNEPITESELADAKTNFRGRCAFEVESNRGLAMKLLANAYHELGDDYLANYFRLIDEVTLEQVLEVSRKYLDPDRFMAMIVGDNSQTQINTDKLI